MKPNRVAIIGECMVELQKSGDLYKQTFGGDTLNTAIYLSRLTKNSGIQISYLTGLGKDPFSHSMINAWNEEGIDTTGVRISQDKLPGMYAIETAPDGERSFYYWRNDAAAKYWIRDCSIVELAQELSQYQLVYLSGISLAILTPDCREKLYDALLLCHEDGVKIAFDNNYRPALWESSDIAKKTYLQFMHITDIAFLTFDDEVMLYGDSKESQAIERAERLGIKEIVIKRGSEPCIAIKAGDRFEIPATKVANVIDTTAAGDSFSAGYLAKRLLGADPEASAQLAHRVAGTVIQYRGAIIPQDAMPQI